MTAADIQRLREDWKKLEHVRTHGGINTYPTSKIQALYDKLDIANDILFIFPECESTRLWLTNKRNELEKILNARNKVVRLPIRG